MPASGNLPASFLCNRLSMQHDLSQDALPESPRPAARAEPFNERGVTLSRAGLSASGQLFPLRDLRNATVVMVPRQKTLPVTLSAIGVIVAVLGGVLVSGPTLVLGIMLAVVGYLSWITQDVIYRLFVTTDDGEREVFTTKESAFAERVAVLVRAAIAGLSAPVK